MATGRKIVVEFLGDDKSLSSAANKAESRMGKFGSKLKSIGKMAGLGLAAGFGVAAVGLVKMTQAAAEDEAQQVKLAQSLKNSANATDDQVAATEDWISAQGKALGVTDDELRPALARLVTATKDVGEAQKLASLAMDVSAGSGKSLESVSTALMKAANGQVSSLSRLGINVKNAAGETITFEQAQRRMAATFKGQAQKQADTLSGKMARLKLILGEAGEEIGAKLIPVVTKMAEWFLNKGLPAMQAFGAWLGDKLPPIFAKIKGVIDSFTGDGGGKLSKFVEDFVRVFKQGVVIVQRLWALFGDNILEHLKTTAAAIWQVVGGLWKIIQGIFQTFSALLQGDWQGVWDGIQKILEGAVDVLKGLVRALWSTIRFAFKNAGVVLRAIFGKIWDGLKALAKKGAGWVVDQVKAIPGNLRKIAGALVQAGGFLMAKLWDKIKEGARNGAVWLVDQIRAIPGRLLSLGRYFLNAGKGLIGKLLDGLGKVGSFVGGFAQDIWEAVKGAINAGIDSLNNLLEFRFEVKGIGFDVNAPDIPHLARGTRSHRGGLAVVGEEGPELVSLPRGSRVTPHGQSMGAMRGLDGGTNLIINIHGVTDKVGAGREIEQVLIRYVAATGRPLQVRTV